MLQLRPTCENCRRQLPPHSTEACICSFECTFCRTCVDEILVNVCPNCGGGFMPRPVRPRHNWKNHNCLDKYPASTSPQENPVDVGEHILFAQLIRLLPASQR